MEDINPINVLAETSLGYAAASAEELAAGGDGGVPAAAAPAALAPFTHALDGDGDEAPAAWLEVEVPRAEWDELGLDTAPFTVQHCAPMSLVHFYFSQLTLNCVFVVDRGRFVGMINKQDMHHADVV